MNADSNRRCCGLQPLHSGCASAVCGAALLCLVWGTDLSGQEYYVRNWHLDDGLPDGDITAIEQTPDGFLWVGTPKGLARFDGLKFRVFNSENTPALTDLRVSSLLTDDEGTLWVGTLDGNLARRRAGRFESVHPPLLNLPASETEQRTGTWLWRRRIQLTEDSRGKQGQKTTILPQVGTDLIPDREGALWWRVDGQDLMRLKAGRWTVYSKTNGVPMGEVEQLCCDREGQVWVEADGRLYRHHGDHWDSFDEAVPLDGRWPVLVMAQHSGLWVAEPRGSWLEGGGQVRRLVDGRWRHTLPLIPPTPLANRSVVTCLLEDCTGQVWYGTPSGGLFFCDNTGSWRRLKARGSVSQGYICCLFEDQQGNIWVGALGDGLYRVRRQPVTMLKLPQPQESYEINTVWAAHEGSVWIGTGGAGVARWQEQNRLTVYGVGKGLDNPHVCALFEDSHLNIWAGTERGLFRLEGDHFVRVEGPPELDDWVKALFEDRAGRLWIGTVAGLISYEQGEFVVHPWPVEQPLDQGRRCDIRALAEDAAGNLWVGTIGQGLLRLPLGSREGLQRMAKYPAPDARCLHFEADGTLWIGSWGSGLIQMREGQFRGFTPVDGLPCEKIQSIVSGPDETIWLSSDNGLIGVALRALEEYQPGRSPPLLCWRVSLAEGLGNRCCSGSGQPVATRTADGRLWFPNYEGVAILDPRRIMTARTVPNVKVESVLADGKALQPAERGEFRVPSGVRRFEFCYVAPDLAMPRDLRFRHKLEGLDQDWVEAEAQRVASYSRLPPGQYQFRVTVGGSDGRWHESSQRLSLRVIPHLWELRWLQVLTSALLIASVGGGIALNERRKLHRRLERLEAQRALEEERRRIARDLHDELGARLTSIALNAELTVQQNQLPTTAKSEINSFIRGVRQLISATDEVIWTTDPENDTLPNLVSFLGDYVERALAPSGVGYRLEVTPVVPDLPVAAQGRHNLLLAVKETINNALRHAEAKVIRMEISAQDTRLDVKISDNGRGYDPERPRSGGKGIENIKSRMELIQGYAEIVSQPGQGTTVVLSMPLPVGYEHKQPHHLA